VQPLSATALNEAEAIVAGVFDRAEEALAPVLA